MSEQIRDDEDRQLAELDALRQQCEDMAKLELRHFLQCDGNLDAQAVLMCLERSLEGGLLNELAEGYATGVDSCALEVLLESVNKHYVSCRAERIEDEQRN